MRLAYFSPLPPVKSGIADYSAALLEPLRGLAEVTVFDHQPKVFDPADYDALVYQLGNNPHHVFVYEMALRYPGVVVLHEANLHHLVADMTIKNGDWDGYMDAVEFDRGLSARRFAERVRRLEVGPDYEGVPMLRRVLGESKGVIVHSRGMIDDVRSAGFLGPVARIPHGAWIPQTDRNVYRYKLGVNEIDPLLGIFGFLKPYKRIAECLRAFRRLVRLEPRAKLILVGETHPEFPVTDIVRSLGLTRNVRLLGYTPIEDFTGYLGACDIILNLRYPTVGESSGTLLRSLGLGKAVLVSAVGSFQEFPDEICCKVPVDSGEEDALVEYLNLLVSRPEVASAMGRRARQWVERECNWQHVAEQYAGFVQSVAEGRPWSQPEATNIVVDAAAPAPAAVEPEYLLGWTTPETGSRSYVETHITRLVKTLEITPRGGPSDRILEMGAYMQITPSLQTKLGYGEVRGCYFGTLGEVDHKSVTAEDGEVFTCDVELFNAEKDPFPYPRDYFSTVLCCELIEHLAEDPMHMMAEINRVLKTGGHLVLTTPNISSMRALSAILQGYHPGFFPAYIRPAKEGEEPEARHNREYTPREIHHLLTGSGFEVTLLETGEFLDVPQPELGWIRHLLDRYKLSTDLRGDGIYAVGRKTGPIGERYPAWLYSGGA
jgi:glycosyltransferase involved in cell wall biosynthesis/SAM-dependent methyltransferase